MNRSSLRVRVTTFYVGMLAVALFAFGSAVYVGVRAFLTKSLEHVLISSAHNIVTDFVVPRETKGDSWFVGEISESYPPSTGDIFVRVSQGGKILYASGDARDPLSNTSPLPLPNNPEWLEAIHRETASGGQRMMIYTLADPVPGSADILVETGATVEPLRHVLRSLLLIMLLATPVILVVAALGGYALMSQPLRPVVVLTEQAERVGRKELGERLPVIPTGDELERLSLALNRMIERLEEALAHNHRFSADASHELRTPLTIIRGELEELMQMPTLPGPALEGIGSTLEEIHRMSQIVHSLMTISRLDCGGERMETVPVNLTAISRVTLEHMNLLAEEKHISVNCHQDRSVYVMGDPMRLKQVMVNLVDNAIKYTPNGGSVYVTVTAEGGCAVVKVSDTGMGIPAAALPFIFDRFFREDKARSRGSGGIGLGLSIVKSICGAHDATVSAESVEGKGTTIRVELPLLTLSSKEIEELEASSAKTVSEEVFDHHYS